MSTKRTNIDEKKDLTIYMYIYVYSKTINDMRDNWFKVLIYTIEFHSIIWDIKKSILHISIYRTAIKNGPHYQPN